MLLGMISIALTLGVSWIGYGAARRFVRDRLRYVAAALTPAAAIIAAVGGAIALSPLVWLLPSAIASTGTALVFGLGVGLGTRAGATDVKRGYRITDGGQ